jgi:hypothetical protein
MMYWSNRKDRWTFGFALLLGCAGLIAAPATQKAATRAAGESDGSGPRAAQLLMDKMTLPGKPETALPFYHVTATRERVFAKHLSEMDVALTYLHKAAAVKFGKEAADDVTKAANGTTVPEINAARIEVNGDKAKVWFKDNPEPTTMVRVGDEWKISVKEWVRGVKDLPTFRGSLSKLAGKVSEIAKGIESGRYGSAESAKKELTKAKAEAFGKGQEDDDSEDPDK